MPTYKDRDGKTVNVKLDVDAVERCRSIMGVDLYDLSGLGALAGDMLRFLKVIHCVLADDEDFGRWWSRHTGDAGADCVEAFVEALCDFFPTRLATMVRELNRAVSLVTEAAWSQLESEHVATCGALRVISESTPASSLFAN